MTKSAKKIDFDINNLYVDKAEQWKKAIPYMKKDWALRQDQCFSKATSALNKLTPENFDKISEVITYSHRKGKWPSSDCSQVVNGNQSEILFVYFGKLMRYMLYIK